MRAGRSTRSSNDGDGRFYAVSLRPLKIGGWVYDAPGRHRADPRRARGAAPRSPRYADRADQPRAVPVAGRPGRVAAGPGWRALQYSAARSRSLQSGQRFARASRRRSPAPAGRGAPEIVRARRQTWSRGSAATNSRSCSRSQADPRECAVALADRLLGSRRRAVRSRRLSRHRRDQHRHRARAGTRPAKPNSSSRMPISRSIRPRPRAAMPGGCSKPVMEKQARARYELEIDLRRCDRTRRIRSALPAADRRTLARNRRLRGLGTLDASRCAASCFRENSSHCRKHRIDRSARGVDPAAGLRGCDELAVEYSRSR